MLLGLDLIAAHMVGDYILQWDWIAINKRKHLAVLIAHCILYAAPFALVSLFHTDSPQKRTFFFVAIIFTHFFVDKFNWQLGSPWPPKGILVDQTLHIVILAILARILL